MFQYPGQKRGPHGKIKQQRQKHASAEGNSWSAQEDALFGRPTPASQKTSSSSSTTAPSPLYCEPCAKPDASSARGRDRRPTRGFNFKGNQKPSTNTRTGTANVTSKLSNLFTSGNPKQARTQKSNSNLKPPNKIPNSNNHLSPLPSFQTSTLQSESESELPTNPNRRHNISRTLTHALASQIPLPCAHCNSIPFSYNTHPFFGPSQRICSSHPLTSVVRCVSCSRFQSQRQPFARIGTSDARICAACARSAILDDVAAKELYEHVLEFLQSRGLLEEHMLGADVGKRLKGVPVRLVGEREMHRQSSSIGCDANSQKMGLTIWSELHLPIPNVDVVGMAKRAGRMFRRGGKSANGDTSVTSTNNNSTSNSTSNGTSNGNGANTQANVRRNILGGMRHVQVQKILCLKGLPRNLMGSILAHEAIHAWLAMNPIRRDGVVGDDSSAFGRVRRIEPIIEEGICQLVSHLYLQTLMANDRKERFRDHFSKDGPSDVKLNQYFKWSIENHSSPIYGGGFKKAAVAYTHTVQSGGGLKELLQYVTIHRDFPPSL